MARAHRIAVSSTVPDARAQSYLTAFREPVLPSCKSNRRTSCFLLHDRREALSRRTRANWQASGKSDHRNIHHQFEPCPRSSSPLPSKIGFLPGVTDNVGKTAKQTIEDVVGRELQENENSLLVVFRIFLRKSLDGGGSSFRPTITQPAYRAGEYLRCWHKGISGDRSKGQTENVGPGRCRRPRHLGRRACEDRQTGNYGQERHASRPFGAFYQRDEGYSGAL